MDLARVGRSAEAVQCFRKALARGSKVASEERVRLLVCLGDALMEMANTGMELVSQALTGDYKTAPMVS